MILEYMEKLHKDVLAQKAQAKRIVEYQHLFEVIFILENLKNLHIRMKWL